MKQIYEAVKSIQNQPVIRHRPPSDDEDYDDYYFDDDDYSEDEGTSAPLKNFDPQPSTNELFTTFQPKENPQSNIINGYTNTNLEINVKKLKTHNIKSMLLNVFYYYFLNLNYRSSHYQSICLMIKIACSTFATVAVL